MPEQIPTIKLNNYAAEPTLGIAKKGCHVEITRMLLLNRVALNLRKSYQIFYQRYFRVPNYIILNL